LFYVTLLLVKQFFYVGLIRLSMTCICLGSATEAASHLEIPLINAGDGAGEHPTQVSYKVA
jgi:aspartate carbamoyltransferase catalytic subunit